MRRPSREAAAQRPARSAPGASGEPQRSEQARSADADGERGPAKRPLREEEREEVTQDRRTARSPSGRRARPERKGRGSAAAEEEERPPLRGGRCERGVPAPELSPQPLLRLRRPSPHRGPGTPRGRLAPGPSGAAGSACPAAGDQTPVLCGYAMVCAGWFILELELPKTDRCWYFFYKWTLISFLKTTT